MKIIENKSRHEVLTPPFYFRSKNQIKALLQENYTKAAYYQAHTLARWSKRRMKELKDFRWILSLY